MHESLLLFPFSTLVAMGIPPYVVFSWLATAIILCTALVVRRSLNIIPVGVQNFVEVLVEFGTNLTTSAMGDKHGMFFFPFVATLGIYILVGNFLGLIPGLEAPTSNVNTTVALALPVFFATHYYGIKTHKLSYIKHFLGPMRSLPALPLMILIFLIEIIGHIARPITLSVRLFG
nr:F0F1 ATP synthase subunit A [bacterium]